MNLKSLTKAALSLTAAGVLVFGVAPGAFADEVGLLTQEQELSVRSTMIEQGIPTLTQDALVAKLQAGELLDSQKPEATPVSTSTVTENGFVKNVSQYADGSIRWTEQAIPEPESTPGTITPFALNVTKSGCAKVGVWYTNCKVGVSDLVSNAFFRIDYTTNKVRDYRAASCSNSVGSCTVSGGVKRATAGSAGPAWAELSFKASVGPIANVANGAFGIRVSGNTATVYG